MCFWMRLPLKVVSTAIQFILKSRALAVASHGDSCHCMNGLWNNRHPRTLAEDFQLVLSCPKETTITLRMQNKYWVRHVSGSGYVRSGWTMHVGLTETPPQHHLIQWQQCGPASLHDPKTRTKPIQQLEQCWQWWCSDALNIKSENNEVQVLTYLIPISHQLSKGWYKWYF